MNRLLPRQQLNFLLALLTAVLLVLIFPGFNLTWLANVALTPLLIALAREPRPLWRFILGWTSGIVFWFGICYWIQFVLEVHGGMGRWVGWATFLLFCVLKALHLGLFSLLAGVVIHKPYALPAIAALWVGIERTHGPFGFAWLTLGNAGIDMALPMRLAPMAGVYGLSFIFALVSAAVCLLMLNRSWRDILWVLILPVLLLLPKLPASQPSTESAVVVQPNIDEDQTWTSQSTETMQRRLFALSLGSATLPNQAPPKLIVWPEVPGPLYFYSDSYFREQATNLARLAGSYFLFGTVAQTPGGAPLNSALLLAPSGKTVDRYDKLFLVPFGEFVPSVFSWVNRITTEIGDFAAGTRLVVFPVGEHKVGTFICYESAFPHLVRRFTAAGADVLVNISNDGYFGHSAAREQHLQLVRMRAAENRRWIVRATNDGITATLDPAGHVVQRLTPYREDAARVGYSYVNALTPYTRFGDWFAWGCLVAGSGAVLVASRRPHRTRLG